MGNGGSAEDAADSEFVTEYLDEHPRFLVEYIDRNPHLLDGYVYEKVDEATVKEWLERVKTAPPSQILQVGKIDYQVEKNTPKHYTDKYVHKNLVVRRAARFELDIYFKNREYLPAKDEVFLEFAIGNNPKYANETKLKLQVDDTIQGSKWSCMMLAYDSALKKMSVDVNIPSHAIIGRYKLAVVVESELEGGKKTERTVKPDIVVIFNPFSKDDDCYLEDESQREEYVLNDVGLLYRGSWFDFSHIDWSFGQFDEGVLDIALKLLRTDRRSKDYPDRSLLRRSSPVYCSRVLSAMVNSDDRSGVVVGDWSGDFSGGKNPSSWSSSVKILKQWNETNEPVKYGQCWVFAGVLNTVLRAIGIAARPITNFNSAHDREYNMTIDEFYDKDYKESERKWSGDSIWNFHVWNEGYFKRPDLPEGYHGWQVIDATPQESSNYMMQCGPAPVKAVKRGEIYIGYDTDFVFGEVNADVLEWRVDDEGKVVALIRRITRHVGRKISTKAVGSDEREDLTDFYKYKEKTDEERDAFERAYAHGKKADYHDKLEVVEDDGAIKIATTVVGKAVNGKDVTVDVEVTNTTSESCDVTVNTVMHTILYTGRRRGLVVSEKNEVALAGNEANKNTTVVGFHQYGRQLADDNAVRVTTTVRVAQTDKLYVSTFDFHVKSPEIMTIKCDDKLARNEYNAVKLVITNPLPVALTTGEFSVDGSGMYGASVKATHPIAPGETYESEVMEIKPYRLGKIRLLADFDAMEIMNIKAHKTVEVEQRE